MSPFFTIVIPTYNHADFLKCALSSVVEQTFRDWECIVIDNHSEDKTNIVIESFNDSRIHLHRIHNKGIIAKSRNLGISKAKGQWIAFLDSDDRWYQTRLEYIHNYIKTYPDCDVISTDEFVVDLSTGSTSILRYGPYEDDFYRIMLLQGNRLSTSATVLNKKFLSNNGLIFRENEEFITAEDYDLWLRVAYAHAKFMFLRCIAGEYSIHRENSSGNLDRHFASLHAVLDDHVRNIQYFTENKQALWYKISGRITLAEAKARLKSGEYLKGLNLICKSMVRHPVSSIVSFIDRKRRNRALNHQGFNPLP